LYIDKTQPEDVFLKNKSTDELISAFMNEFAAEFKTFVLTTVEKYQQLLPMGPWSTAYDPEEPHTVVPENFPTPPPPQKGI